MVDAPTILTGLVLLFAVPVNWFAVWRVARLHRTAPNNGVLRTTLVTAVALAIIVTLFGLVFLNNELDNLVLSPAQTPYPTRVVVLLASLPPLYWLWLYR